MNLGKNSKILFITFSNSAYRKNQSFYNDLINLIEKDVQGHINYRWFEAEHTNPSKIHTITLQAIRESQLFIAEVSVGSTGVGQQITFALQQKKPVILLMQEKFKDQSNNLFLKGISARNVKYVYYQNLEELDKNLRNVLKSIKIDKLTKFNFVATSELKRILRKESEKLGISQSELLRNIVEKWIVDNNLK